MNSDKRYTTPRTFGVYELPQSAGGTRRFRFGNHPVRQQELEREFGQCTLIGTYEQRAKALAEAAKRNAGT